MQKAKKNKKKSQINGNCNRCGKRGHKAADCWEDPQNASKVPVWYKTKGRETDKMGLVSNSIELILCSMKFPSSPNIILDPNVWIAKTVTTVHSTPHNVPMFNIRAPKSSGVTSSNGTTEKIAKVADMHVKICTKNSVQLGRAKLTDVGMVR